MQIDATSSRSVKPRSVSYRLGPDPAVLAAVREPGVLLPGWERGIPGEIAALLDARRVGERDFFEGHADVAHPALFDRAAMEHPPDCPFDANREIVRDAAAVRRPATGDVLGMRGSLAPGGRGAVHRSPPIEAEGIARIVLVVTTVERP